MRYYTVEPEMSRFESIAVDLTHRCNIKCANCYIPNRQIPDMDKRRLFALLARLPSKTFVRLLGGEPTLRKDLPEIIESISQLGHRPVLITNGLKIADKSFLKALQDKGLKYISISMSGADDDSIYKVLDGGPYAARKARALQNALELRFLSINTISIIAKGVNEGAIKALAELWVSLARKAKAPRFGRRFAPVMRLRSFAPLGRSMKKRQILSFEELISLTAKSLNVDKGFIKSFPAAAGSVYRRKALSSKSGGRCFLFPYETEHGPLLLRLTDWTVNEEGIPDPGNRLRGRVTEDFKLAPAFEHIKKNEGAY